jgi:hypothetical protein
VIIAGGIGFTPMLNLLRVVRDAYKRPSSAKNRVTSVLVLWSLREEELLEASRDLWSAAWGSCRVPYADSPQNLPAIAATVTKPKPLEVYGELFGDKLSTWEIQPFNSLQKRRVSFESDIPRMLQATNQPPDSALTLYVCGPKPLTDDASAFARRRPHTLLHTETFEL